MKYADVVQKLLNASQTEEDISNLDITSSEAWDIDKNEFLQRDWREYVEANSRTIYIDIMAMETELLLLRNQRDRLQVYVKLIDSLEAVLRLRGYERGGLIR